MKIPRSLVTLVLVVSVASYVCAGPPPPVVQESPTLTEERPWAFNLVAYGWLESLDGTVGVRGIDSHIDVPFSNVLKELNIGAMGVIELRYKRWTVAADLVYADLRGSLDGRSVRLSDTPFDVLFTKGDYEQKQFLGNFTLSYQLIAESQCKLELYAGARVNSLDSQLTLIGNRFPPPPAIPTFIVPDRELGGSKTWVDPIVGARFVARLQGPLFVRVGGDIGGFGVSSDLTWQANAILGVDVARNFSVGLGFRGLGTNYSSGGFKYDVIAYGPIIGSEFRF